MGITREEVWFNTVKDNLWGGKKKRQKTYRKADEALAEFDRRFTQDGDNANSEAVSDLMKDDPLYNIDKMNADHGPKGLDILTLPADEQIQMFGKESEEWLSIKAINIKEGFVIRLHDNKEPMHVDYVEVNELDGNPTTVTTHVVCATT